MECHSFFRSFKPEEAEEVEKGVRVHSLSLESHQMRRMVFDPGTLFPTIVIRRMS